MAMPATASSKTIYDALNLDWVPSELNDFDWEVERDQSPGREVDLTIMR
ncbi:MAG: hypothetical protein LBK95_03390 [Bifidobacteriaceae bacterium]|jgi:hypothetical protein|nr:hypothetical protein [Bifidobacteriaceae bacterium]